MLSSLVRWCVVTTAAVVLLGRPFFAAADNNDLDSGPLPTGAPDTDDYLLKQVVWKRCYRKLSPACLKLSLVRTVEMMSKDSTFFLAPGVYFSSNSSESHQLPPELARSLSSDYPPLEDLVAFSLRKYLRSLTLNVNLVDFVSGGNETLQNSAIQSFTGRKKEGLGGYGAIAGMMGVMMATTMMAGLAALAGKALMTSLAAMMMAVFAALKGGGGGGGESKTYEVITKPIVSHVNTHSSEVQHEHHGHYRKRSVSLEGGVDALQQRKTEENYGLKTNQPEELPYHQYYHSINRNALDSSKIKYQNSGGSLNHGSNEGYFTNNNDGNGHKVYFDNNNLKGQTYHNRLKKRNVLTEPTGRGYRPGVGFPLKGHKEFPRYTEDEPLWALGFFQ